MAKKAKTKTKLEIHWNAFWAIGGALIGAILMTAACAGYGFHSSVYYSETVKEAAKEGITYSIAANENAIMALAWICVGLTIIPLFFNRKPVRSSIYAATFVMQLFAFLSVFFEAIIELMSEYPVVDENGLLMMVILSLIAFFIFDIIGESVWLGLQNRKAKKLGIAENNVSAYGKFKFVWGGIYAFTATTLVAVLATIVSYVFGTLSGGKPEYYDEGATWAYYDSLGHSLTELVVALAWISVACSVFLMFFDHKAVKITLFVVSLIMIIVSSVLLLSTAYYDAIGFIKGADDEEKHHSSGDNMVMLYYAVGLFVNVITFIITIVSGPVIISRYMKSFKNTNNKVQTKRK